MTEEMDRTKKCKKIVMVCAPLSDVKTNELAYVNGIAPTGKTTRSKYEVS